MVTQLHVEKRMAKKPVATASDPFGAIQRIEATVRRIEDAVARLVKLIEPDPLPRINPDRRYRIAELEQFGFKPGLLYKRHKDLIRKDGHLSYMLGRDVLTLNETAPKLVGSAPATMTVVHRRRGRPRKDVKRSTTDDSTDSLTIGNVVAGDNRVVRIPHWMHRTEKCFGLIRKAA
jgi:hypothetical protein